MSAEKFKVFVDMTEINDSMELDTGTKICEYSKGNIAIEISVVGDVRIFWQDKYDEPYFYPSEFPEELRDLIHNEDMWFYDDRVDVRENNWFEAFITKDGVLISCPMVDVERSTSADLKSLCEELIMEVPL